MDASCASRQREALRLLRRGMDLLDSIAPVAPEYEDDWLRTKIRLSNSLAFVETDQIGFAEGLGRLDAVDQIIQAVDDPAMRAELAGPLNHNYGLLLIAAGHNEDGIRYLDIACEYKESRLALVADPVPLMQSLLNTLSNRSRAYAHVGDIVRARADVDRAIRLADQYALPVETAEARHSLATLELRTGNVPAALRYYDQTERIYRDNGLDVPAMLRPYHAEALLIAGLAEEAGRQLDEVLPLMREQRSATRELVYAELFRASAALMSDDVDLARRLAKSAGRRMRRWGCETCVANAAILGLQADVRDALRSGDIPVKLPSRAARVATSMSAPRLAHQAAVARMLAARLEIRRNKLERARELLRQVPRPGQLTPIDYRMLRRLCRAELAVAERHQAKALAEISSGFTELDRVRDRMGGLELVSAPHCTAGNSPTSRCGWCWPPATPGGCSTGWNVRVRRATGTNRCPTPSIRNLPRRSPNCAV